LLALLADDPLIHAVTAETDDFDGSAFDVAIVSSQAAAVHFSCPVVVLADDAARDPAQPNANLVVAMLHRPTLTGAQLRATVHAVAAGLRVDTHDRPEPIRALDDRSTRVLELLAEGCSTREIAERMSYSERTIKKRITELQAELVARSRAQLVAQAIRGGLI